MVPQVPHRFLGFNTPLVPQLPDRFLGFNHAMEPEPGSMQVPWVQPRHWFHRIPDRFFGFNRGTVGIVQGVNFGNYPNYIFTIFGMGGDTFLTGMPFTNRNHATGSTGSRQVPWVQTRNGSTGSRQVLNTPLVPQVPDRFLGFNRGTVGIVEGVNHQTVVLGNVPLSINQQREPWSLGNLVSHSSCLPIILEPCFLSFCLPSLCYYPFILALFIFLSSIIISSYCPPLSLHLVSLRLILLWPIM